MQIKLQNLKDRFLTKQINFISKLYVIPFRFLCRKYTSKIILLNLTISMHQR